MRRPRRADGRRRTTSRRRFARPPAGWKISGVGAGGPTCTAVASPCTGRLPQASRCGPPQQWARRGSRRRRRRRSPSSHYHRLRPAPSPPAPRRGANDDDDNASLDAALALGLDLDFDDDMEGRQLDDDGAAISSLLPPVDDYLTTPQLAVGHSSRSSSVALLSQMSRCESSAIMMLPQAGGVGADEETTATNANEDSSVAVPPDLLSPRELDSLLAESDYDLSALDNLHLLPPLGSGVDNAAPHPSAALEDNHHPA
eukprot:SAG25_NODE_4235_length_858_cov_1.632411_1_plen_256_part_10